MRERYGCSGKPAAGEPWKEGGRCQHDSHDDPRCEGCWQRRTVSTKVPLDGTGGVGGGKPASEFTYTIHSNGEGGHRYTPEEARIVSEQIVQLANK